ncbi:MAG: methyltransferase domain-containing protein [Nitrospirae bacterium]|nr:MAG: methyltransferase domain-containing protein [Nitrospirota bacterium]
MRNILPFTNSDPHTNGAQYIEDLATAYWFSGALFSAVELDIFGKLGPDGMAIDRLAEAVGVETQLLGRFVDALCALGLVGRYGDQLFNMPVAKKYLVAGKEGYQGDSIMWRKYIAPSWQNLTACLKAGGRIDYPEQEENRTDRIRQYVSAMDNVARAKSKELVCFFEGVGLKGEILDAGAGSGAVAAALLKAFPDTTAVLMDLPEVVEQTRSFFSGAMLKDRVKFHPANMLEEWDLDNNFFDIVILSNIVHAYSEAEITDLLRKAALALKPEGMLLIHDFFFEHYPQKAALFDINMLINTYNGRVFSSESMARILSEEGFYIAPLAPLSTDTAVLFASKSAAALNSLTLDMTASLVPKMRSIGFKNAYRISVEDICVADWTAEKCRFGCGHYGSPQCPPNSDIPQKTRELLRGYKTALLLEGEPPTRDFQAKALNAEKAAFSAGFHKALVYWAGPCSMCEACVQDGVCRNSENARPSMEGAGIDVFGTVRRLGVGIKTLEDKNEFVKYFALLLLE